MQNLKKPVKKTTTKEKSKEEKPKSQEEKLKKSTYNASTPRSFVQRSSAADIYQKAPKKVPGSTKDYKSLPMKDNLKAPSSISLTSRSSRLSSISSTSKTNLSQNSRARTAKDLPFVNVTVNSPITKRKLDIGNNKAIDISRTKQKSTESRKEVKDLDKKISDRNKTVDEKGDFERMRTKTRTLDETEVKQLTPDKIDNNEEMLNLKKQLVAKPKAFYVGLDEDNAKAQNKSDEEISYEDDFESYESDFDSYHSESNSDQAENSEKDGDKTSIEGEDVKADGEGSEAGEEGSKEKDEENMLDSGSFDLREQRSAKSKPAAMEFILETEEDKVSSLDEGFQEGSSAVSSMRTVHVEVLDRPLFVDFNKSKEQKRKKRIVEQMMRRAKDILSMVTLHEMSFTLFEMKPISYDLYMATFGRTNHTQVAAQTFEDGITEEIQTDDVAVENKWTQHPVKFSKSDVYLNDNTYKNTRNSEDYMSKFNFLLENNQDKNKGFDAIKEYKENPLRILLEEKHGVGSCEMLPYETYKNKQKSDFTTNAMGKFLKKVESRVSRVLNLNKTVSENVTKSSLPFSSGYVGITTQKVPEDKYFLKQAKITGLIFSENKSNLILTVHKKLASGILAGKCVVCLWDASITRAEPLKILVAIDNVIIGRFRGNTDGIVVAALEDGSIHLWDLSEEPTWRNEVVGPKASVLEEVKTEAMTQTEMDREWNLKNINAGYDQLGMPHALQTCAFSSSAGNLTGAEVTDPVVGLEFAARAQGGTRRVVGQVCSLQRLGILTIWTIVQEKTNTQDSGKAYWSKMKLEKTQTISLTKLLSAREINDNPFNLNAGKRRLVKRKQEKLLARNFSRQKSAEASDIDRPASVTSARRLPAEKNIHHDWESGMVCEDLKIMQYNNTDRYLVAKNNGEVLSCTRSLGAVKVERLCVSTDTSPITCLAVSPHGPFFLAAAAAGAISLYSLPEARVLLTLDCRNAPPQHNAGPQADFKGRFVEAPRQHSIGARETSLSDKLSVSSVLWSCVNPCCMFTLSRSGALACWQLTRSDIYPTHQGSSAAVAAMSGDGTLALVTDDGDVQIHRLAQTKGLDYAQLFHKYVALL